MKILHILRKHYLATVLLIISLAFLGYTSWGLYGPNQVQNTDHQIKTTNQNSREKVLENKIENNKATPQLKIPETVKPTSTENQPKNIESAAVQEKTNSVPQDTSTPMDLTQGTFIINGRSYPVSFTAYSTVYEVIKNLNDSGQIKVDFKDYNGLGYFVDGIDGIKSDTFRAKYWIYYINGAKAQVGISNYELKSGDIITWKYESAE